jgi:hypothetical protein
LYHLKAVAATIPSSFLNLELINVEPGSAVEKDNVTQISAPFMVFGPGLTIFRVSAAAPEIAGLP